MLASHLGRPLVGEFNEDLLQACLRHGERLEPTLLLGLLDLLKQRGQVGLRLGDLVQAVQIRALDLLGLGVLHAHEVDELAELFVAGEPELNVIPTAKVVLDLLDLALAPELPGNHDPDARAQGLALRHGVGRQHDALVLAVVHVRDDVPQESLGDRVHSGGGLVQQNDLGIANHRRGHRQLPLVASRVRARELIRVSREVELGDDPLHLLSDVRVGNSPHHGVHG
mmetsp:Transcript_1969/g.7201  ORF Transcript_1969/g.7201 Transcript_1969/m.7201 type:complete len:226 (-) Transcript_1969:4884-5561(-)